MRMRVTLRIALREQEGGRLPADELHQEADRLMETLIGLQEPESFRNVATSSDAAAGLITAQAILEARCPEAGVDQFSAVVRRVAKSLGDSASTVANGYQFDIEECVGTVLRSAPG